MYVVLTEYCTSKSTFVRYSSINCCSQHYSTVILLRWAMNEISSQEVTSLCMQLDSKTVRRTDKQAYSIVKTGRHYAALWVLGHDLTLCYVHVLMHYAVP